MAEAIELGAGLANLGGQKFVMVDELVFAEGSASRTAGNTQQKGTLAKARHRLLVYPAHFVDFAVADPFGRVEHLCRGDVVRGAGLVFGTPFRRPPFRGGELRRRGRLRL